ncbi:hypothetical protein CP985_03410 [Malaciobacter mytili LMG 24559]|uniref:Uncharacterized protein n=1 Tax=Malaciobacter mytili LMG 24559 TaxID=1032238 RepID=A0AAX2AHJ5_9BACT|nr:hypothetical protein [Malaciobacter mytili]AXH16405.1 hypothetical protein AMYT_a0107 [Malaciobacter mytili LMG 24559]RXK16472.1 hypothetical protein CP985_03410 [Malaciobacter mytili LMG 24559]
MANEFRQTSITIPKDIYNNLETLLNSSTTYKNLSPLIARILKDFFDNANYLKEFLQLDENTMLISSKIYREIENISPVGLNSRVQKKQVKLKKIGNIDYVIIDEDNFKNVYLKVAVLIKNVKEMGLGMIEMNNRIHELENTVSELTETVALLKELIENKKN